MNDRWRALLLLVVVMLAFLPALSGGFVWDDDDHLTQNPYVAAPDGLRDIWSSLRASRYYPLTLTTFWGFRQLFGLNPLPYHLLNVVVHALNALLFWQVLRRLDVRGAWAAALLWAVHPVMVESVAWVTELKNTQSTFFLLVSLWCWLDFEKAKGVPAKPIGGATVPVVVVDDEPNPQAGRLRHRGQKNFAAASKLRSRYGWAVIAFAAALASKPAVVMLPVVLLVLVWWRRGRWQWADVWRTVPFFALSAGMALLTILEQHRTVVSAGTTEWQLNLADRCLVAGRAVWFYAGKLFWPVNLTFVYPRWETLSWWPVLATVVVVAALWWWRRTAFFGVACFVVLLTPVLGFFNVYYFRYSFVADHFNYLPSMALLALVPAAVMSVVRDGRGQRVLLAAGAVGLGALTWQQTKIYREIRTLWEDTLAKNPACWMAHNNLGTELGRQGRHKEVVAHYRAALQVKADYPDPHNNLGNELDRQGQTEAAMAEYFTAVKIQPTYSSARYNLALALMKLGRTDEAIREYQCVIEIHPHHADAHFNLGMVYVRRGEFAAAIPHFTVALQSSRDPAAAHNLALALRKLGRTNEADRVVIPR